MVRRVLATSLLLLVAGACADPGGTGAPDEAGQPVETGQPGRTGPAEPGQEGGDAGTSPAGEEPVRLELPAAAAGRCMAPSVDLLAGADSAFEARVDSVEEGEAVLAVDRWYTARRGAERASSVVVASRPGGRSTELAPVFRTGERYLVAAVGSQVLVCGASDVWSAELERLYRRAFG